VLCKDDSPALLWLIYSPTLLPYQPVHTSSIVWSTQVLKGLHHCRSGMNSHSYGPRKSEAKSATSFMDAPPLNPGQDRKAWRRDVEAWVDFITQRANSGEKASKATQATFGYLLYSAVHSSYQSVLNNARDSGTLDLRTAEDSTRAVRKIVELIGEDTPLEDTNRVVSAYQDVHQCCRLDNESPSIYADRFRGLASVYMSLVGISSTTSDSQLLAMVLLQNAKLDKNTNNAIKIQLITQASQRPKDKDTVQYTVSQKSCDDLETAVKVLTDRIKSLKDTDAPAKIAITVSSDAHTDILDEADKILWLITAVKHGNDHKSQVLSRKENPKILLDDVFNVLHTLDSSKGNTPTPALNTRDVKKIA